MTDDESQAENALSGAGEAEARTPAVHTTKRTRFRYRWVIGLALVGVLVGGAVGWSSQEPLYQSEGLIYIAPSLPSAPTLLPMTRGFVGPVEVPRSRRVTLLAMETPAWQAVDGATSPEAIKSFEARLRIFWPLGRQHIQVQFRDPDPEVAQAGAKALLVAYEKLLADPNSRDDEERLEFVNEQLERLAAQGKHITDRILTLTSDYGGVEGLEIRHRAGLERTLAAEEALAKVQDAIRIFEAGVNGGRGADRQWPPDEIAVEDPQMEEYLFQLALLEARMKLLITKYDAQHDGQHDEQHDWYHARLAELRAEIAALRKRIDSRAEAWNLLLAQNDGESLPEELRQRERRLIDHYEPLLKQSKELGRTLVDVQRLKAETDNLKRQFDQFEALLAQLKWKVQGKGRIKIVHEATRPIAPVVDPRKAYAARRAALGGLLGALLVVVLSLVRRRKD